MHQDSVKKSCLWRNLFHKFCLRRNFLIKKCCLRRILFHKNLDYGEFPFRFLFLNQKHVIRNTNAIACKARVPPITDHRL